MLLHQSSSQSMESSILNLINLTDSSACGSQVASKLFQAVLEIRHNNWSKLLLSLYNLQPNLKWLQSTSDVINNLTNVFFCCVKFIFYLNKNSQHKKKTYLQQQNLILSVKFVIFGLDFLLQKCSKPSTIGGGGGHC